MILKGILDNSLGNFLTLRGYASMESIEKISVADESYQRDLISTHKTEIVDFLKNKQYLFFPEVILSCVLEVDETSFSGLHEHCRAGETFDFSTENFRLQNAVNKTKTKEDMRALDYFRRLTLTLKNQAKKPLKRIDGNHRISAALEDSDFKKINIPFCIVFFKNKEESDRFSRVIFHNINAKSIPLKMEDNLKLILDHQEIFSDDELKENKAFGWEYYFARKINQTNINTHFENIKDVFDGQFRTIFLKLFKTLIDKNLLEQNEDAIDVVNGVLTDINSIYSNDNLKNSKSGALFSAFVYYKLSDDKQLEGFKNWVLKNHIYTLTDIEPQAIIDIYDKIAKSKIKNIFVAMAFSEQNCNNVWDAISTVYDELIRQDGLHLDISKTDQGKYIPNRVDKGLDVSKDIIFKIKDGIANSDLVIVDLSYQKQNVYYEMGLAEAQQKPLILLHDQTIAEDKIHFDVNTQSRMQYNSNDWSDFRTKLKVLLKAVIEGES
jgi:hypothetical protein